MRKTIAKDAVHSLWDHKALTNTDFSRVVYQINEDVGKENISPSRLHALYLLATNSKKYDSRNIPNNVVTLNSEVILVTDDDKIQMVKIVLPRDRHGEDDVSVYSPLGLACLGAREKHYIHIRYKDSVQRLFIQKIIFQPEKERIFHL